MKTGKSLQALAAELERSVESRKDYIAPQGRISATVVESVDGGPSEVMLDGINGEPFGIQPYAHKQLGDVLGIPARYYERMRVEQPHLLAGNINAWLKAAPEEKRMVRALDGRVRAVLTPKYRPLDNFELAQAVLPNLMALNVQVVSSELTETRMYIKCILPELCDELPAGMTWGSGHNKVAEYDGNTAGKIVAALVISNSEVGNGTLRIEPSVYTTWCTNLAILKAAAMRKYHIGRGHEATDNWEVFRDETRQADDRAFFLKVADVTDSAFRPEIFRAAVAQLREATTDAIQSNDIGAVVEAAVQELTLPGYTKNSILTFLARGGDMSRWGLSSAITATANVQDDYETATDLERAGGTLLAMTRQQFAKIANAATA